MIRGAILKAAAFATALSLLPAAAWGQASPSDFTSAARYDALRRVTGTIAPDPDGPGPLHYAAVRSTYDSAGRLVKVEKGELAAWQSEAVAPRDWTGFTIFTQVDTAYDPMNRKVREAASGGGVTASVTEYGYDLAGRLRCTAVRMNPDAWATPLVDKCVPGPAHATNGFDRITRNSYDLRGNLLKVEKGVGTPLRQNYAAYTWSDNGKQTSVTDASGNRAEMNYDGLDRQSRWIFPSPAVAGQPGYGSANPGDYEEYGYDSNANRTSLRKRDGVVLTYEYDSANRLKSKTVPASVTLAAGYSVYYAYDNRGLQTEARFGSLSGFGVSNAWNGFGEQASASTGMGGSSWSLGYGWDLDGNRIGVGGIVYAYDGLDRLAGIYNGPATPLVALGYAADGSAKWVGNVWATTLTAAMRVDRDSAGRLGRVTQEMAGLVSNQTDFAYNPALQIVSRSTSNDAYVWNPPHAVDRAYQANGLNQYAVVADAGAAASAYTYDANGNLTSNGTSAFVYDSENRLVSARGAKNADLSYDPLGRLWRVADPIAGTATRFFYDGDRLVFETSDTGTPRHYYVHGNDPDQPLVWWDLTGSNNRRFLHSDHQGSIVAVSRGENGSAFAINSYDPWGVPGANNAPTLRFGYTGQAWLPELGMYYYKARIYYPALGRFLQTDPIGYEDENNLYTYVDNDPVNSSDPTGTQSESCGSHTRYDAAGCTRSDGSTDGRGQVDKAKARGSAVAVGATAGLGIGVAAAAACDGVTVGICTLAGPAIVGGSTALGGVVGGLVYEGVEKAKDLASGISSLVHGNSLQSQRKTYVYELIGPKRQVMKYGITSNPIAERRYSFSFYEKNSLRMQILAVHDYRSAARAHEVSLCVGYVMTHGSLPALSSRC